MTIDWTIFVSLGALVLSIFSFLNKSLERSLSIREHEEFRRAIGSRIDNVVEQVQRDIDRIDQRTRDIEQTRPTTGELQATMKSAPTEKSR